MMEAASKKADKRKAKPDGIELTFGKLKYILTGERNQWVLHRGVNKKNGDGINWDSDNSYFGRFEHVWNLLIEEIPRRSECKKIDELHRVMVETREMLKSALEPYFSKPV